MDHTHSLDVVIILAVGFALASILGFIAQKLHLSPILGFLLGGYMIGPFSPGYVADQRVAEQMAEIGVILMMFGVGLHFKLSDLLAVKHIAIPGAVIQTAASAIFCTLLLHFYGWSFEAGIIMGIAVGVASTVVLVRAVSEHHLFDTMEGNVAIGWLIVEDILTVIALILLPALLQSSGEEGLSFEKITLAVIIAIGKFIALAFIIFTVISKLVTIIFDKVAGLKSNELFTLTVLAVVFGIATASTFVFGTSIALGAFLAGMVIGKTNQKQRAKVNSLPIKEAFAVIFFLTIGMLFDTSAIIKQPLLFSGVLAIILLIKPLVAFLIVVLLREPKALALTVAIALAQIGEFSFILAEEASSIGLLPDEGYDVLVASALVSISINPILFQLFIKKRRKHVSEKKHQHEVL